MAQRHLALALLVLLCGPACGYRAVSGTRAADPNLRRIEIRFFENESSEPGFERMLADALVEEFLRRGQLAVVYPGSPRPPDLVLRGVIRSVEAFPASFSSVGLALENRIQVELGVALLVGGGAEVRWEHRQLTVDELFLSSADAQVRDTNREQALRRLAAGLARRIHDEVAHSL